MSKQDNTLIERKRAAEIACQGMVSCGAGIDDADDVVKRILEDGLAEPSEAKPEWQRTWQENYLVVRGGDDQWVVLAKVPDRWGRHPDKMTAQDHVDIHYHRVTASWRAANEDLKETIRQQEAAIFAQDAGIRELRAERDEALARAVVDRKALQTERHKLLDLDDQGTLDESQAARLAEIEKQLDTLDNISVLRTQLDDAKHQLAALAAVADRARLPGTETGQPPSQSDFHRVLTGIANVTGLCQQRDLAEADKNRAIRERDEATSAIRQLLRALDAPSASTERAVDLILELRKHADRCESLSREKEDIRFQLEEERKVSENLRATNRQSASRPS